LIINNHTFNILQNFIIIINYVSYETRHIDNIALIWIVITIDLKYIKMHSHLIFIYELIFHTDVTFNANDRIIISRTLRVACSRKTFDAHEKRKLEMRLFRGIFTLFSNDWFLIDVLRAFNFCELNHIRTLPGIPFL